MEYLLSLGSNVGDRKANIKCALSALSQIFQNIKRSSIYESQALLPINAPQSWDMPYLNICISGRCTLNSNALLDQTQAIEKLCGRKKKSTIWSPRVLDIDILMAGDKIENSKRLVLPHPGFALRDFMLIPAIEIEPDWIYPLTKRPIKLMLPTVFNNLKKYEN